MIKRVRSRRDDDHAEDSWLKFKLKWLDALAQDQPTRGLPHDIAILIVRRYLFEDPGYAWISMDRLASELDVARSSVLRAFDKLIEGGWLDCERGGTGRGDSNRYYMPDRIPHPKKRSVHATLSGNNTTESVAPTHKKRSAHATRVSKESGKESERVRRRASRRDSPSAPDFSSRVKNSLHRDRDQQPRDTKSTPQAKRQQSGRSEASRFPTDWILGNEEIATAHRLVDWDLPKTEEEFAKFKAWHADKGSQSSNWPSAWETWCRRGQQYEAKQDSRPLSGLQSEMLGYNAWLQNQKQTKH
jgi:hypothetical protein